MRKLIEIATVVGGLVISTAAFADQPVPPPGNPVLGAARYDANPGRQQATAVGAQCGSGAASGAFGFFGKDNNLAGGAQRPANRAQQSGPYAAIGRETCPKLSHA